MRRYRGDVAEKRLAPLPQCKCSALFKSVVTVAMVVLPLTYAQTAWGQGANLPAPGDSAETWFYRFFPIYSAGIEGNVTRVLMKGDFNNTLELPYDLRVITALNMSKEEYRLRPQSSETKNFTNTVFKQISPGFNAMLVAGDSRLFNRIVKPGGSFQDLVANTQSLVTGVMYTRINPSRFRWDATVNADVSDSEKSFKKDELVGGNGGGGAAYTLIDEHLVVRGRGYLRQMTGRSVSNSGKEFPDVGEKADSVGAAVDVRFTDSLRVQFDYTGYRSIEDLADQARGGSGNQLVGAENVIAEHKEIESRLVGFSMDTRVLSGLGAKVVAQHMENSTVYREANALSTRNVTDFLRGDFSYVLFTGTNVTVGIENRETLIDLGPRSPRSYNEVRKRIDFGAQHMFSPTLSFDVSASTSIAQSFYLLYEENPRDRDQLDNTLMARLNSTLFTKLRTSLSLSVLTSEIVNVDASLSDGNLASTKFDFRPGFVYQVTDRVSINQSYGLAIEYTEMTFRPDENFLDRNVTFSNEVSATLSERLRGRFKYSLFLHDKGSYLPEYEGGERFLNVDRKDRLDETEIRLDYRLTDHMRVIGKHEYSRKVDTTVDTGRESTTTMGGIEGGVTGSYDWGQDRELAFTLVKANRYSPFNTDERNNDYWVMNAQFKYSF